MHFTVEAQNRIRQHFSGSEICEILAVDATAGNGFDTLFLAELVGARGRVFAVDIQQQAIEAVSTKLIQAGMEQRVQLHCECHSRLGERLDQAGFSEIHIAMFNLGYLPHGDKSVVTLAETSIAALEAARKRLHRQGIMSILSYPGHQGGDGEHQAVEAWVDRWDQGWEVDRFRDDNNSRSPVLWLLKPR